MNRLRSLVAGGAFTAALTAVVYTAGAAAGLYPRPALILVAAGVVAAARAGVLARAPFESVPFRIGALAAGASAYALDVLRAGAIGELVVIAVVAAVVVAVIGPPLGRLVVRPIPGWLAVVGLIALAAVLVRIVVGGGELGHDEAAYALKARAWLEGTPDTGWELHRGIGQSVLALAVLPLSESALGLRLLSVVLSVGTVVAVWA